MKEGPDYIKKASDVLAKGKRAALKDSPSLEFGKVPPQARDLEEAVLGACMVERGAVEIVVDILRPESFYDDRHQRIYRAVLRLFEQGKPIDLLTIVEQLRFQGELDDAGGAFYVTDLTNRVASGANAEFHARIIAQKYIQRELIRVSGQIIKDSYEDTTDVFDLLDRAEQNLFAIAESNLKRSSEDIASVMKEAVRQIQERMDKNEENQFTGVASGFMELDRATGGWQKSDLVIVAARPGMGKTAFTLALARNAAVETGKGIAFFSLEMSSVQLVNRLISMETELPGEKLRKGTLADHEWTQLTTKINQLEEAPIFIDDTPAINIFELRAKCRRLKSRHDIQMIIVDYLQLMSGGSSVDGKSSGNREQEISQISRSLKSIAKELNVPIIALSQLSRAVETRGGTKKPQLSDLRESGAIEQDADIVIFLYRPEYYGILQDEEGMDCRGIAEVIISKHRNGPLKTVKTRFIDKFAKFADLDPSSLMQMSDDFGSIDEVKQHAYMTRKSKMNDFPELDNLTPDEDIPF